MLAQANASALSLPSTAVQWEVISALMGKAVVGGGGRGFVLEALAFVVNRGLGLLGRLGTTFFYRQQGWARFFCLTHVEHGSSALPFLSETRASSIQYLVRCLWVFVRLATLGLRRKSRFDPTLSYMLQYLILVKPNPAFRFFRHNVVAVHGLLTRFARGDFSDGKADFAWTLQVS